MNENSAAIGVRLRSAREAQGLAIEQVAARLRLMKRQVAAMESGDFAALGQPVFARGFVRNYAKVLGLDAQDLMAQMREGPAQESPPRAELNPLPAVPRRRALWWLGGLAAAVLVAAPIALYAWLTSDEGARDKLRVRTAAAPPQAVIAAAPQEKPPAQAAPLAAPQAPAAFSAVPAAVPGAGVSLRFRADAWVEVRDAQGRLMARGLYHPGQEIDLKQGFPLHFVIGNAAQVMVRYAGRALDLSPYLSAKVARFSLAADGAAAAQKP